MRHLLFLSSAPVIVVLVLLNLCNSFQAKAQGIYIKDTTGQVSITTNSAAPDNSSMLDVADTTRGLLIPRMTTTQRDAISSPATGLLIFNTTTNYFDFYSGGWKTVALSTNSWSTTGNAGTVAGTNFIGTTDSVSFDIRTNNTLRIRITPKGQIETYNTGNSVFIGEGAGANDDLTANENVFVGYQAGNANTIGYYNTASGNYSLSFNTTGNYNTALGYGSLYFNTTGFYNTASGSYSLFSNTTGNYNTALGYLALYSNKTGSNATALGYGAMRYANNTTTAFTSYNVAVGYEALRGSTTASANTGNYNTANGYKTLWSNTSGDNNTSSGYNALYSNTTGYSNTASGYQSLYSNTTGYGNTASGFGAGDTYSSGTFNTFLGSGTDVTAGSLSNCIAIGGNSNLSIFASNTVRIGNSSMTSIGGQVGWTTVSDERVKENIKEDVQGIDFILKLKPITYTYNTAKSNLLQNKKEDANCFGKNEIEKVRFSGFSAQEVEKTAKEIGYDFSGIDNTQVKNGGMYGLRYADFVVPLVKGMQEQQQIIGNQQLAIDNLQKEKNDLVSENKRMKSEIEKIKTEYDARVKRLEEVVLGTSAKK